MGTKPLIAGPEGANFTLLHATRGLVQKGLIGSDEQLAAGRAVRDHILAVLSLPTDDARVRGLAECSRDFPKETLRCPEVFEYFEWLTAHGKTAAVNRILRDRPMRGRPMRRPEERFHEVALIEAIMKRDGCSTAKAAERAREEHHEMRHKSALSLQNDYARARDEYALFKQVRFLPESLVTDREWSRPTNADRRKEERNADEG